ncbi:hypothetical protein [uncultured Dokdonia sp.]|uniref:hypothetical protein n=1 Tax=uncultured Dokdonia sp. TaxID=575653 RepID=UPI002612A59E|nr:hypothetical protein [uncultured Dokdonia sp.]
MKPAHIKCQRLKEVRRIYKRQREVWKAQQALGYTKLDIPIRDGWYKELVITKRIARYKNQDAMLEIIAKLDKHVWGKTKEEANAAWSKRVTDHLIVKEVPTISKKQFRKLSDKAKCLCVPFRYYIRKHTLRTRFYVRLPKGTYRVKYTRAYITHRRNIDPLLEQEDAFLDGLLMRNGYYEAVEKLSRWRSKWDCYDRRGRNYINSKLKGLTHREIQDIINEELSWEKN